MDINKIDAEQALFEDLMAAFIAYLKVDSNIESTFEAIRENLHVQCEARNPDFGGRCQRRTANENKHCDYHQGWWVENSASE